MEGDTKQQYRAPETTFFKLVVEPAILVGSGGCDLRQVKSWATREFARGKLYRTGVNYIELTAASTSDISDALTSVYDGNKAEFFISSATPGGISTEENITITFPVLRNNASVGLTFEEPVVTSMGHPLVIEDRCETDYCIEAQNSLTITMPDAKQLTVGSIDVVDGTTTLVNCKVTGTVKHNSYEPLKMTCSDNNYIGTLTLDMSSAGVEIYGTINNLKVKGEAATVDCIHSSSGCGINNLETSGQIRNLIWRTPAPGILSSVSYKANTFTIETSSTSPQVFELTGGGAIQIIKLEKDINVYLTTDGQASWGIVITDAGTYKSVYFGRP